jgi:Arc/MetJ family transcription regulator
MRTNIEIDDKLMQQAMRVSKTRTKKAAVEAALQLMVRLDAQAGIRKLRGKIQWEGDLEESRLGHVGAKQP